MKLSLAEIIKRNVVKLDKEKGIYNNGIDNSYPQRVERLINNSVTAKCAADKLKSFIIGDGFADESLNSVVVSSNELGDVTLYKLLSQIAHDISRQKAAAVQVGYNALAEKTSIEFVPYKYCRYGKKDSNDYSGLIHVYDNWEKSADMKYNLKDVDKINAYNPLKNVVQSQFEKYGRNYKGQLSILRLDDEMVYPLSFIDTVIEDADTESQIKLFKNTELRKGFFAKYIMYHSKFNTIEEQDAAKAILKKFESGDHESSILMLEAEFNADGTMVEGSSVKFDKLEQNINNDLFSTYEKTVSNNIRKAFLNIPSILIEQQEGALFGSSGTFLSGSFDVYNAETRHIRSSVSAWLKDLFTNSTDEKLNNANFEIKELTYNNATTDVPNLPVEILSTLTVNEKRNLAGFDDLSPLNNLSLLSEKLGVGGTQSLISILQDPILAKEQKRGTLKVLFSLTDEQINQLIPL